MIHHKSGRCSTKSSGPIGWVTADGAYDGAPTYQTIAAYGDGIEVVIPPRSTAVPSSDPGCADTA